MKTFSTFITILMIFCYSATVAGNNQEENQSAAPDNNSVTLKASNQLIGLATKWADAYTRENPSAVIRLDRFTTPGIIPSSGELMLTEELPSGTSTDVPWNMVVARDAIVAVMHADNPVFTQLTQRGITSADLQALLKSSDNANWKEITGNGDAIPVRVLISEKESVVKGLSRFSGIETAEIKGQRYVTVNELKSAFQKDQLAVGLARFSDLLDASTGQLPGYMKILPVDKNVNGQIDSFENIYANVGQFTRGIWIGKYPRTLTDNIYVLATAKPSENGTVAFLEWILTNGQQALNGDGLAILTSAEKNEALAALSDSVTPILESESKQTSSAWIYITVAMVLLGAVALILSVNRKRTVAPITAAGPETSPSLRENSLQAPQGLWYDKSHIWAFMEINGMVRLGIDDFMQHVTGQITRVKMRETGDKVKKGDLIVTIIQDGKQLNLYSPVTGTIKKQNASVLADASVINSSPYYEGWIYLVEPKNWAREMEFLLLAENYKKWLRDEFVRLKDFFSLALKQNEPALAHVILQDGGELADHTLAGLQPEIWEEFQTRFIDAAE